MKLKYLYTIKYTLINGARSQVRLYADNDIEAKVKFNGFVKREHGFRGSSKPSYEKKLN